MSAATECDGEAVLSAPCELCTGDQADGGSSLPTSLTNVSAKRSSYWLAGDDLALAIGGLLVLASGLMNRPKRS
jgi:hypothetical protein